MNLNFLSPMFDQQTKKLVFMDFESDKVYEMKAQEENIILVEIDQKQSEDCFSHMKTKQEEMIPILPMDKINEVLNTEKEVSEESKKHIFRRNI